MKRIFIYILLCFATGCSWDLPNKKAIKTCTKPTIGIPTVNANDKFQFTVALTNTTDVQSVSWGVSGSATYSQPNSPSGTLTIAVPIDGSPTGTLYAVTATYTTTCGEKETLNTSFNTSGCNQPNTKLTRNINDTDPTKTTFVLSGNTSDVKTVIWRNGTTIITNKGSDKLILVYDFQRGTTYNIKAEYTLNCDTKIAEATTDPYTPKSCNAPNIVTVSVSSPTQLIATLSGGDANDIKDNVTWGISPAGGQPSGSSNSGVTFTGLNPDTEYTITADFTTKCETKPSPLPSAKARTAPAPVIDKTAWSAIGDGGNNREAGFDEVRCMKVDDIGNVYVAGVFSSASLDFGNGKVINAITKTGEVANKVDVFVAKYDNKGVCQWASSGGSSSGDYVNDMTIDNNNDVYITGGIRGAAMFGNYSTTFAGFHDVFIAKCSGSSGNWLWANNMGGEDYDFGTGLAYSKFNNQLYLTGSFYNYGPTSIRRNKDRNQSYKELNGYDMFFVWCNPSTGIINDPEVIGKAGFQIPNSIAVDDIGNAYFTGKFTEQFTFKNTAASLTATGSSDIFVAKWNITNGVAWEWSRKAGGTQDDNATKICVDGSKNVYITGAYRGTVAEYNLSTYTSDSNDAFWASYDKLGTFRWAKAGGSNGTGDGGYDISVGDDGNIAVCGEFNTTASFPFGGSQVVAKGSTDIFAFKANAMGTVVGAINTDGGDGSDRADAVVVKNGKMYVAGTFQGTATFSNTTLSAPTSNVTNLFVAKY